MTDKQTVTIASVVPQEWRDEGVTSVWLSGYRSVVPAEAVSEFSTLSVPPALVVFVRGTLTYQAIEITGNVLDGPLEVRPEERTTPDGTYTLVVVPHGVNGSDGNEPSTRRAVDTTIGLLASINGTTLAYERVYDNILHITQPVKTEAFSEAMRFPNFDGPPKLEAADVQTLTDAGEAVQALDPKTQERIRLGLHWFGQSLRDQGLDEFIKLWVAIEALAMPDSTSVRPANELLGAAYGLSGNDANAQLGLGKIQGFRSRVLHNGTPLPVHSDLLGYTRAIYADLLLEVLGLPAQHRARAFAASPTSGTAFDLDALLHIASKT